MSKREQEDDPIFPLIIPKKIRLKNGDPPKNVKSIIRPPQPLPSPPPPPLPLPKETVKIDLKPVECLEDLINLGLQYDPKYAYDCVFNMEILNKLVEPLQKLNNMIGLGAFKKSIVNHLIFHLIFAGSPDSKNKMLHTVLYGSPGTGKTTVAKIIGEIYAKMGYLSKGHIVTAKRQQLIAAYLGQTAIKTSEVLLSAKGGVLFIDEAYSLGNKREDDPDFFTKECIDTLNEFLSENSHDFICIIAGYKNQVERCFFRQNEGLDRRFPYRFTIEGYSSEELEQIFRKMVSDERWSLAPEIDLKPFFSNNYKSFPCYGGDVKLLFDSCQVFHSSKMYLLPKDRWRILTLQDIEGGFENYKRSRGEKVDADDYRSMYI
jgi:hypothetical protein